MSDRYTKLFTLPPKQYSQGAPFIVVAGALHKDNLTETVVAQLKFESISTQVIKAVSISICPYDIAGRTLANPINHQYLDLNAKRGQEFGAKTLIDLGNDIIRSYDLKIDEVIFEDNSIWTDENAIWEQLPEQQSPEQRFTDGEIAKQYYIEYGADAHLATQASDLWICACGGLNHGEENVCFKCGKEKDRVLKVDENVLRVKANGRLYLENKSAEDKAKKAKKIKIIAIPAAIVLCIVLILSISNNSKKETVHSLCERAVDKVISDKLDDSGLYSVLLNSSEDNLTFSSTRIMGDSFQCKGTAHYNYMDRLDVTAEFTCKGSIENGSVTVNIGDVDVKY